MMEKLNSRIGHLITPTALENKHLVVVGLGSGGFPVVQHLAMCGLKNWTLVDKDILDEENLEKHPAQRKDIGKMKTEIASEWIIDRNPEANIVKLDIDVTDSTGKKTLRESIKKADAVLVCTDNKNSRIQVNRLCLREKIPCVTGLVFRTGFGGDCYLYDPDTTACYDCFLDQATEVSVERMMASSKTTTANEAELAEMRYGRKADEKYGLSGLSVDIQFISLLMARTILAVLLDGRIKSDKNRSIDLETQEIHQLRIPYNFRGPVKPQLNGERIVWLNTDENQRYGYISRCSSCRSTVKPQEDKFCSWCGDNIHQDSGIESEWKAIPPANEGYGFNHIVFISRRHLIDELYNHQGEVHKSGNISIALEPLTIQKNYIKPLSDCRWCMEE